MKLYQILIILFFTCIILLSGCSRKQALTEIEIDEENVMGIIEVLTSDKYKGRLTGTDENLLAAEYISQYFESITLENPSSLEDYKAYYEQPTRLIHRVPTLTIVNHEGTSIKSFNYLNDFVIQTAPNQRLSGEVMSDILVIENEDDITKMTDQTILIQYQVFNELVKLENFQYKISNIQAIIITMDKSSEYFNVSPYVLEVGNYTKSLYPMF